MRKSTSAKHPFADARISCGFESWVQHGPKQVSACVGKSHSQLQVLQCRCPFFCLLSCSFLWHEVLSAECFDACCLLRRVCFAPTADPDLLFVKGAIDSSAHLHQSMLRLTTLDENQASICWSASLGHQAPPPWCLANHKLENFHEGEP